MKHRMAGWVKLLGAGLLSISTAFAASTVEWKTLDWLDLMPPEDVTLLENMPEVQHFGNGATSLPDELLTGRVRPEMNNLPVKIPGFIVPLQTTSDQRVTEFFLVPYFGACIHVPPPPPNQIIHVTYAKGIKPDALYDPFWVQGVLKTEKHFDELGQSAYAIKADEVLLYTEE